MPPLRLACTASIVSLRAHMSMTTCNWPIRSKAASRNLSHVGLIVSLRLLSVPVHQALCWLRHETAKALAAAVLNRIALSHSMVAPR